MLFPSPCELAPLRVCRPALSPDEPFPLQLDASLLRSGGVALLQRDALVRLSRPGGVVLLQLGVPVLLDPGVPVPLLLLEDALARLVVPVCMPPQKPEQMSAHWQSDPLALW